MKNTALIWMATLLAAAPLRAQNEAAGPEAQAEVLVYGATPSGICAAIAAAEEGRTVILLAPDGHVGGMLSSGLGGHDLARIPLAAGMTRKLFERIGAVYGSPFKGNFEPKVAARVLNQSLEEAGVRVIRGRAVRTTTLRQGRLIGFETGDGKTYAARVFVDAGYEGDLMAQAGVSYTYGRESKATYGEPHAGALPDPFPIDQWQVRIRARPPGGALHAGVSLPPPTAPGKGDALLPAYSYRPILAVLAAQPKPFAAPEGYRASDYALLNLQFQLQPELKLTDLFAFLPLAKGKYEVGAKGPFSTSFPGGNRHYPDLDGERREAMRREHRRHVEGLFYFIASDPSVPEQVQRDINRYGYARDEFAEQGHFPPQLYIPEARRLVGRAVLTELDLLLHREKPDSVAMGFYPVVCGHLTRTFSEQQFVYNYGAIEVETGSIPYQISYRCLTPRKDECENLLVPVCLSASHIAFGSINREPQWMLLGESAGVAAARALEEDCAVQEIDVSRLQARLRERGQLTSVP